MPKVQPDHFPQSLQLESLEPRLLLSLDLHWTEPDLSDLSHPGYEDPDAFFSDPRFSQLYADAHYGPLPASFFTDTLETGPAFDLSTTGADQPLPDLAAPSAPAAGARVLVLDFDGATVHSRSGDFWLGSSSITIPAFDLSLFGWDGQEAQSISQVLQFVAEDYAAYNLYVTTTAPASGEYSVIYVGGAADWFRPDSGIIGVATYDVGNRDNSNYGFAFSEELGIYASYSGGQLIRFSEYLSNLISHEAGHTFGLNHVADTSYIMNPYLSVSPRQSMFGAGAIPGSSAYQDSQTLLGTNLGYDHGPDDFTSTTAILPGAQNGIIERRDDVDTFSFTPAASGATTFDISTTAFANLDATLRLTRASDEQILAECDDHYGDPDPFITFNALAGETYLFTISSTLNRSSGRYSFNLAFQDCPPVPDLVVTDSLNLADDALLDFAPIMAGATTNASVTLHNAGSADLLVTGADVEGPFTVDPVLYAPNPADDITIPAGASLELTVAFTPTAVGSFSGQLIVTSTDPDLPLNQLTLTGQATEPLPDIAAAALVEFAPVTRGQSASASLQLANTGLEDLVVYALDITSPFTVAAGWQGDSLVVPAGDAANLELNMSSIVRGPVNGAITFYSNDPDEAALTVQLTGQVLGGLLAVHENAQIPDDNQIDLGLIRVGESSTTPITLTNNGDADLVVTSIAVPAPFTVELALPQDGLSLSPGESLTFNTAFMPEDLGNAAANLVVTTDDPETPTASLALNAVGIGGILDIHEADGLDDGLLNAGQFQTGQNSSHQAWTLTNNGTAAIHVELAFANGSHFRLDDHYFDLDPGQTYIVNLIVDSHWAGPIADALTLTADDLAATSATLNLSAQGHAVLAQRRPYRFIDQSGDRVTVILSGDATGILTLGDTGQPDIESIQIEGATGRDSLRILTRGRTRVDSINANGDFANILAPDADFVGNGLHLDGSAIRLNLGNLLAGADLYIAGNVSSLRAQSIIGDSLLNVAGDLRNFQANEFDGATLHANSLQHAAFLELYDGDLEVTTGDLGSLLVRHGSLAGSVNVAGSIRSLLVSNGDVLASVSADADICRILAPRGSVNSNIQAGQNIYRILAHTAQNANIYAGHEILRYSFRVDPTNTTLTSGQ